MRLVLRFLWLRVMETGECILDVVGHGDVDFPLVVVPIDSEANIPLPLPLVAHGAFLLQGCHEVLFVFFSDIFYTKIIHNEAETDGSQIMFSETRADRALPIFFGIQAFCEEVLSYFSGKGEALHSLSDFKIDVAIFADFIP